MTDEPSALPQLALPPWLRAWAARPPEPRRDAGRALVLAFGLVRSAAMLDATMASLERRAPPGAELAVCAYAGAPVFGAAHDRLNRTTLRLRSVALFDVRTRASGLPCGGDARRAGEHRNERAAAELLLHVRPREWRGRPTVVLWRIDTELVSDIDVPSAQSADLIAVPYLQSGGRLNDRFLVGDAHAVQRLVAARAALLGSECVYGETALVRLVRDLKLRVTFTRTRVVRRRADLFVPDVDKAASLGTVSARSWMQQINSITPTLACDTSAAVCTAAAAARPAADDRVFGVHGPRHGCPYLRAWESRCVWRSAAAAPAPAALPNASLGVARLLVLGDSLDAQLFAAVACHLHAHRAAGLRLSFEAEWENNITALTKRCDDDARCHYTSAALHVGAAPGAARAPFGSMHLCQGDRADCLKALRFDPARDVVSTGADALHGLAHKLPRAFARGGVPNATVVRAAALRDARSVLKLVPASRLVWREATAQHFDAPGGHWRHGFMLRSNVERLSQRCANTSIASMREHAHWNAAVAPLMRQHGVRVLPIWEESALAWFEHVDHGDCTHFCQPGGVLERWAQALLRLVAA